MTSSEGASSADPDRLVELVNAPGVAYWTTLGIQVERVATPGEATLRLPMRDALVTRRPGVMHGGAVASLIDAAAGASVMSRFADEPDFAGTATLDMNVTYLAPATSDALATGRILRSSRTLAFIQVDVHDESGAHLATGRATYMLVRKSKD